MIGVCQQFGLQVVNCSKPEPPPLETHGRQEVVRLTGGTIIVEALLERRRRRASMSDVRRVSFAMYDGAVPCRQR